MRLLMEIEHENKGVTKTWNYVTALATTYSFQNSAEEVYRRSAECVQWTRASLAVCQTFMP